MKPKVKICGITNYDDAKLALDLGADALGFNFSRVSPRAVLPLVAQSIIQRLPKDRMYVGVFVNQDADEVLNVTRQVALNTLQFHGDEDPAFCKQWKELQVIKALRFKSPKDISAINKFSKSAQYFLFDRYSSDQAGGSGKTIEVEILEALKKIGAFKLGFLAGGLTPDNVGERVKRFKPFGVDVASGVEYKPGKKDATLMKKFMEL